MLGGLGKSSPFVVVFSGLTTAILLGQKNLEGFLFSLLVLFLLISKKRVLHAVLGVILGLVSLTWTPGDVHIQDGEYVIEGHVKDSGFDNGTYRIYLNHVKLDGKQIIDSRKIAQINVYEHVGILDPGASIRSKVMIKMARPYGNSGEFDYKTYLKTKGIVLTGYIKDFDNIETVNTSCVRDGLKARTANILSNFARPDAEVLKAMLIGDDSFLADSLRDSFNRLGLAHLIAISGLNIGLVILFGYMVAFTFLRCIPPVAVRFDTPLIATIFGLLGALAYAHLVGTYIPVMRATIMAVIVLGALFLARRINILNALAFSGVPILLIWPLSIFSASFLLSFAAVLGIAGILEKIKTASKLMELIAITVAATVFTLPIVWYIFGFVSPVGLLANIVFVPLFSVLVMPVSLLSLVFVKVSETLSSFFFLIAMDGIRLIFKASNLFGKLVPLKQPWLVWVFACYLGLILSFFGKKTRLRTWLIALSCVLIVVLPFIQEHIRLKKPLTFDFISVGQGDSTLITSGPYAILIDAGGPGAGRYTVAPHLLKRGVTKLDLVVITHPHPDHMGGMPFILDRFYVDEVWMNMDPHLNPEFEEILHILNSRFIPQKIVCLGDVKTLGDLTIKVLNPPDAIGKREKWMNHNLYSAVLLVQNPCLRGLFMADAGGIMEISLAHLDQNMSADVLKVAHHGGSDTCLSVFLDKVKPVIAVIPCGYKNRYNDPSKEVLERLNEKGIQIYRTDINGEVEAQKNGSRLDIKSGISYADNILKYNE
jgi:competence protein ComEC